MWLWFLEPRGSRCRWGSDLHKALRATQPQAIPTFCIIKREKINGFGVLGSCTKAECYHSLTAMLFPEKQTLDPLLQLRRVWRNAELQAKNRTCFGVSLMDPACHSMSRGRSKSGRTWHNVSCDMKTRGMKLSFHLSKGVLISALPDLCSSAEVQL